MAYPFRYILLGMGVALLWAVTTPTLPHAQSLSDTPASRPAGATTNVFTSLDPNRPLDALQVRLPDDWALRSVRLLRYGTKTVPTSVHRGNKPGTHLVEVARSLTVPHDLVLRVQLPDTPGTFEWGLQTFVREGETKNPGEREPGETSSLRTVARSAYPVIIESRPEPDGSNHALSFTDAYGALVLREEGRPALGQSASFTIEFWMRTSGLDEVILSTWSGEKSMTYPAEFVVDPGGRLRFYTGRPGEHQALWSASPVADGQWHHVAAVHDASQSRLRLLLDGQPVDSLRGAALPAAPARLPLVLGGRRGQNWTADASPGLFSGYLDELRIWGEARSASTVRRTMNRMLPEMGSGEEPPRRYRLGFEEDPSGMVQNDGEGIRRVPVSHSYRSTLRNLRAESNGQTVTLRWTAESSELEGFVVERSSDGQTFRPVAELAPAEAKRDAASGAPEFSYTEDGVAEQVVFYRIRVKGAEGDGRPAGTIKIGLGGDKWHAPVRLLGNFPNPFSETTTVAFEVDERTPVTLTVFNVQGLEIRKLVNETKSPGYHEVRFDAADLPSGIYFVRLQTPAGKQSDRMVLLK